MKGACRRHGPEIVFDGLKDVLADPDVQVPIADATGFKCGCFVQCVILRDERNASILQFFDDPNVPERLRRSGLAGDDGAAVGGDVRDVDKSRGHGDCG